MKWKTIDSAPKDGTDILTLIEGECIQGRYINDITYPYWQYISLNSHGCGCCADNDPEPTHWMPLPESPK